MSRSGLVPRFSGLIWPEGFGWQGQYRRSLAGLADWPNDPLHLRIRGLRGDEDGREDEGENGDEELERITLSIKHQVVTPIRNITHPYLHTDSRSLRHNRSCRKLHYSVHRSDEPRAVCTGDLVSDPSWKRNEIERRLIGIRWGKAPRRNQTRPLGRWQPDSWSWSRDRSEPRDDVCWFGAPGLLFCCSDGGGIADWCGLTSLPIEIRNI